MRKTFEDLYFPYTDKDGNPNEHCVNYMLSFENDKLIDVVNEYGYPVEKTGGVWEFFDKKYNQ